MFELHYNALLPLNIWRPWWPQKIGLSGLLQKFALQAGADNSRPVPYVKIEVFDVDRDAYIWPWLCNRPDLMMDRPVARLPDLLKQATTPTCAVPVPEPALDFNQESSQQRGRTLEVSPPFEIKSEFTRVGDTRMLTDSVAARMDKLTLTSSVAPWHTLGSFLDRKSVV